MDWFWWFRFKGTVIKHIWWQVAMLMVYTFIIVGIHTWGDVNLGFGQTLIPVIGVVVGLLLGFRTNIANSRYEEGRKQWASMTKTIRSMVISVWGCVQVNSSKDLVDKKSCLNLALAFAISVKHYLRAEYSYQYADLKDLIAHIGKYSTPSSTDPNPKPDVAIPVESSDGKNKDKKGERLLAQAEIPPTNIPLDILAHLNTYGDYLVHNNLAVLPITMGYIGGVSSLLDNLTAFERILRTPIPLAYALHLHHFVWLNLLAVPFQFVGTIGWWTILIVGVASFCMLGILAIGDEIENPFGYDDNDLPLDDFCKVLKREIEMITGHPPPLVEDWLHSDLNRPFKFASLCDLNAPELAEKTPEELQKILTENAKLTRLSLRKRK